MSITSGLVVPTVLTSARREHLVKDGTSLVFLLTFLKTYATPTAQGGAGESVEHLSNTLKRAGCTDLLEFFPLQRRSAQELNKEFKARGLEKVADWYAKVLEGLKKEQIVSRLREMVGEDERASNEEVRENPIGTGAACFYG